MSNYDVSQFKEPSCGDNIITAASLFIDNNSC